MVSFSLKGLFWLLKGRSRENNYGTIVIIQVNDDEDMSSSRGSDISRLHLYAEESYEDGRLRMSEREWIKKQFQFFLT